MCYEELTHAGYSEVFLGDQMCEDGIEATISQTLSVPNAPCARAACCIYTYSMLLEPGVLSKC